MNQPYDFYNGVRVEHKNGICGTILSPDLSLHSTTVVTIMTDKGDIMNKVPIEKLEIIK